MQKMANNDDECWSRVKGRLRTNVGEDVYSSWFARMDLESVSDGAAHMSVPTRFLKSWIQSHYADRVLSCWQAEMPTLQRVDLTVRTPMQQAALCKDNKVPVEELRVDRNGTPAADWRTRSTARRASTDTADALGPSPLDPRLTFDSFVIGRSNTLAHAAAKQVAEGRRGDPVMFNPLYVHAGVGLGKTHLLQAVTFAGNAERPAQGAVSHRREVHVRLRTGAEEPDCTGLQGHAARHRRAGDRRPAIPAGQVDPGRVLPHAERADRFRPAGGDRRRPSAVRSREPRRSRALAACRRPRRRDGLAR